MENSSFFSLNIFIASQKLGIAVLILPSLAQTPAKLGWVATFLKEGLLSSSSASNNHSDKISRQQKLATR